MEQNNITTMVLVTIYYLLLFLSKSSGQNDSCLPDGVILGCKCAWSTRDDNSGGITGSQDACGNYGGRLAVFDSMDEATYMVDRLAIDSSILVGAIREVNVHSVSYHWVDMEAEPFFSRWGNISGEGETGKDCLTLEGDNLTAVTCDTRVRFLCQRNLTVVSIGNLTGNTSQTTSMPHVRVVCQDIIATPKFVKATPALMVSMTTSPSQTTPDYSSRLTTTLAPYVRQQEQLLKGVSRGDIWNMSTETVRDLVDGVNDVVTRDNNTDPAHLADVIRAVTKLGVMKNCDQQTFKVYADTVSTLIDRVASVSGQQDGRTDAQSIAAVPGALEKVMMATNVSSATELFDSFDVDIRTVKKKRSIITIRQRSVNIRLAAAIFSGNERVLSVVYRNLHRKISRRCKKFRRMEIGSKVISVGVQDSERQSRTTFNTSSAINFTVSHLPRQDSKEKSRVCAFWHETDEEWSDTGCRLLSKNSTHTTCTCSHLTSFAVLVLYYDNGRISDMNERVLYIMSAVGCSLSILGLAMTLTAYIYLRMLHRERVMIHANLALSLMMAQIVFVSSADAHADKVLCKVVAVVMHFFFMAAFTWMLVEGICLYLSCVRAQYNVGDMRIKYAVIGWGLPILIVVLSTAIQFPKYGDGPGDSCWLSTKSGLIWAFLAPMFLIVIFNVIVLGMVIRVFLTLKANSDKTEAARVRAGLKAMMMLLPLLGMTWMLGLVVPYSTIFHYLFVIGNSLQGLMIFFLHCMCNSDVRKFLAARRAQMPSTATSGVDPSEANLRPESEIADKFDDVIPSVAGRRHAWP